MDPPYAEYSLSNPRVLQFTHHNSLFKVSMLCSWRVKWFVAGLCVTSPYLPLVKLMLPEIFQVCTQHLRLNRPDIGSHPGRAAHLFWSLIPWHEPWWRTNNVWFFIVMTREIAPGQQCFIVKFKIGCFYNSDIYSDWWLIFLISSSS